MNNKIYTTVKAELPLPINLMILLYQSEHGKKTITDVNLQELHNQFLNFQKSFSNGVEENKFYLEVKSNRVIYDAPAEGMLSNEVVVSAWVRDSETAVKLVPVRKYINQVPQIFVDGGTEAVPVGYIDKTKKEIDAETSDAMLYTVRATPFHKNLNKCFYGIDASEWVNIETYDADHWESIKADILTGEIITI